MQIEYRRNMKQSLMIVQTEGNYRGYELEMCAQNQIAGLLPFETVVADGEMQFWYDITGMQSLETVLETRPITVPMLEKLVRGVAWSSAAMRPYLLDDNKLMLRADTIYFDSGMEHTRLVYCPVLQGDAGASLRQVFEYLLPKLDYANEQAVQKTYALYQAAVVEQVEIDRLVELLGEEDNARSGPELQPSDRRRVSGSDDSRRIPELESANWKSANWKSVNRKNENEQSANIQSANKNSANMRSTDRNSVYKKVLDKKSVDEKPDNRGIDSSKGNNIFTQIEEKLTQWLPTWNTDTKETSKHRFHTRHPKKTPAQEFVFEPEDELVVEHPTVYLGGVEAVKEMGKTEETCIGKLCHQGMNGEESYTVEAKPLVVGGRYGDADIRLDADGVSRIHALVARNAEGEYYVEDLNSINGTYVNGEQLAYHQQCILHKNDELMFATEVFLFT